MSLIMIIILNLNLKKIESVARETIDYYLLKKEELRELKLLKKENKRLKAELRKQKKNIREFLKLMGYEDEDLEYLIERGRKLRESLGM